MEIQHTAVAVSDLDATRAFYEDGLGLAYDWDFHTDDGVHNYYVTGESVDSSIQFVHDPEADGTPDPSGIEHLAVRVDDVDATLERLVEETGCPVTMEPKTVEAAGARAAFVEDPDGYEVEIYRHTE